MTTVNNPAVNVVMMRKIYFIMEAVAGKEIKFKNLFEFFVYGNYS